MNYLICKYNELQLINFYFICILMKVLLLITIRTQSLKSVKTVFENLLWPGVVAQVF